MTDDGTADQHTKPISKHGQSVTATEVGCYCRTRAPSRAPTMCTFHASTCSRLLHALTSISSGPHSLTAIT